MESPVLRLQQVSLSAFERGPEPRKNRGADTAAVKPGTSTIIPARPSDTSSPPAIWGSSPTGSVSVMTITNAPSATAPTDDQPLLLPASTAGSAAEGSIERAAVQDDDVTTRTGDR
jgi:hypothetical protein